MNKLSALTGDNLWVVDKAIDIELIVQSLSLISNEGVICLYGTPCDEVRIELEKLSFSNEPCLKEYDTDEWTYMFSFKGIRKLKNESFHILLNKDNQKILADLAHKNESVDICTDLIFYEKEKVLLEASGISHNPIVLNGDVLEELVKLFTLNTKGVYMTYTNFMEDV